MATPFAGPDDNTHWEMRFRFVIYAVASGTPGGGGDSNILTVGYDPGAGDNADISTDIYTLNEAVSQAMAFCRRFDSVGRDVRAEVYGQPFGGNNAQAAITLQGNVAGVGGNYPDVSDEDIYAKLDTVPRYLKQRMAIASRPAAQTLRLAQADEESEP